MGRTMGFSIDAPESRMNAGGSNLTASARQQVAHPQAALAWLAPLGRYRNNLIIWPLDWDAMPGA